MMEARSVRVRSILALSLFLSLFWCVFHQQNAGIIYKATRVLQLLQTTEIARNRDCAMIENQQRGMGIVSVGSVSSMSSSSSSSTMCGQQNQKLREVRIVECKSTAPLSMSANHTVVSDQSSRSEEKQTQDAMSTGSSPLLVVTFPVKLRMMLDHVHDNGLEDVVSWELDGKAFKVQKIDDFEKQIMPSFSIKPSSNLSSVS